MIFNIIRSGSAGNSSAISYKNTLILIDVGICVKNICTELKKINKNIDDVDYVFVTHDHSDHINNIKSFSPKKIYSLEGNLPSLCNVLMPNTRYQFNDFFLTPFPVSHDASNPCGFYIEDGDGESMLYMTDLGCVNKQIISKFSNPTYLVIESNHDVEMLMATNRPKVLKNRIISKKGHLSNKDSAIAAAKIIGSNTKEIILAHLSREANTPNLALETYKNILREKNIDIGNIKISCSNQFKSIIGGNYEY